jgi:hypothetical protein
MELLDEHQSTGSPLNLMMSTAHITSNGEAKPPSKLTSSASFKAWTKKPNPANAPARVINRAGSEVDDIITLLHGFNPVRVELNCLENDLRGS